MLKFRKRQSALNGPMEIVEYIEISNNTNTFLLKEIKW